MASYVSTVFEKVITFGMSLVHKKALLEDMSIFVPSGLSGFLSLSPDLSLVFGLVNTYIKL